MVESDRSVLVFHVSLEASGKGLFRLQGLSIQFRSKGLLMYHLDLIDSEGGQS